MSISSEKLTAIYTYHPPQTEERKIKHEAVNEATIAFAKVIAGQIDNPAELTVILRRLQEVRMMAHAAITYEENGLSYRDLFNV